jgi:hypothetical protein
MTATPQFAYIPGTLPPAQPLARFLPPLSSGVATHWLLENIPSGSWILDPFAASPWLAVEAARAGYRVLVAANNPISRFFLEMLASPPEAEELQAALAYLAGTRSGEQRLEPYIQSLYQTECDSCGSPVIADAYIWNQGEKVPEARIYRCQNCGQYGEYPATPADAERARQIAASIGLHQARALERVAALNDPDRQHAEEALAVYLPRAVLALFSLINKIDALDVTPAQRNYLRALILSACDKANSLWSASSSRPRPKQLTISGRFYEHNVWKAMEDAIELWAIPGPQVSIQTWNNVDPEPESGTLVLFEGPLRDLTPHLQKIEVRGILAALPRPNQAFWTLSALWAGWLWGREAVGPFKSVLRRRRYDWSWHTSALHAAFSTLVESLEEGVPALGLMGESEPGFISAALLAAQAAGLSLEGIALRAQADQAQIHWRTSTPLPINRLLSNAEAVKTLADSARRFLSEHGEPVQYLLLHSAGLAGLVSADRLPALGEITQGHTITHLYPLLQESFSFREGFLRYSGNANDLETGHWWLRNPENIQSPMADRCEIEMVNYMLDHAEFGETEITTAACEALPGLHTPEPTLIAAVLESYAEKPENSPDLWHLRPEDKPRQRHRDLDQITDDLARLGKQLGYRVELGSPLNWLDDEGGLAVAFYLLASANIQKFLTVSSASLAKILVLPGGRSNLMMYKLRRDPHLAQEIEAGWRFLKFRHVLQMADNPTINRDNFAEYLELDPLTYSAPQMRLF